MIIGFGFGTPLQSILMLLLTALVSYFLFRGWRGTGRRSRDPMRERERLREYYFEQRRLARENSRRFDLTDEEIERRLDEELGRR